MKAYKGFNKDLKCRGFQYEIGKTYEMKEDEVKICEKGFHSCESPLDVWDYYGPVGNRFCEVETKGKIEKEGNSSKICSSQIELKAEIGIKGLVHAMIDFVKKSVKDCNDCDNSDSAKIGSSGYYAQIGSSGDYAQIGSSGGSAQICSSGDFAKIGSSGNSAKICSSGDLAKIGSSGNFAQIGSSGNSAQIGSSGDSSQIGSSGGSAQIGSSGDSAQIGSSGYYAQIESSGEDSVICCAGSNSKVKAKKGSWITLAEWKYSEEKKRYIPVCVKTEFVDGEKIKEDTWYRLKDGGFEVVEE